MPKLTQVKKQEATTQIAMMGTTVKYDTKDYTVELIVEKFARGDFFAPAYQREFIWTSSDKSYFIESVLLGLPIPFMFWGECEDGKMEIIDGVQRINTLASFVADNIVLSSLKKLSTLNGFRFSDLELGQQRRFQNKSLRIIVLDPTTTAELRQDIFSRVNKSGKRANDSEFRRGTYPGKLTEFIDKCRKVEVFKEICPLSNLKSDRFEGFELLLRFFAYVDSYQDFKHDVAPFLDSFLTQNQDIFDEQKYWEEFTKMCEFVRQNIPNGFASGPNTKMVPRVRFEAISVGVALALRENPGLAYKAHDVSWLESEQFKELTTSDSSNNPGRLKSRVEYVRNQLMGTETND